MEMVMAVDLFLPFFGKEFFCWPDFPWARASIHLVQQRGVAV